jgi:hypothetical protein
MRGDDRQSFTGLYNMKERKEEDVLRKQGNCDRKVSTRKQGGAK